MITRVNIRAWLLPTALMLITLVVIVFQMRFSWLQYHNKSQFLADQQLLALDVAYRSSVEMYRLDIETRYRAITQREGLIELMRQAQRANEDELSSIRERLYQLLIDDYRQMLDIGLRQFHFHLPNDKTLLRFHRPEWLGDGLFTLRPSVKMVHAHHKQISGFEFGRTMPAFRHVYPIHDENDFLGSVEISLPFEMIHDNLMRLLPVGDYTLLLDREALYHTVDREQQGNFIESVLSPGYLQEHPDISRVTRNFVTSPIALMLNQHLSSLYRIQTGLKNGETFSYPLIYRGKGYLTSFYAINDLQGEHAAYLVAFVETPLLTSLRTAVLRDILIMAALFGLLTLALWQLYRQHRRLLHELHRQQQAESELQRSNKELEQFAYAISHDMRQPLRMISGHIDLLKRSLSGRLDEDESESMRFAIDGAKRMDNMIVSLLNYSRVGRKTDPMSWHASREDLDEAIAFLAPDIDGSGALIEVAGEWPRIYASRDEITRLLQNLLGNAIKYRLPEMIPELKIDSACITNNWHVRICDNGIGIIPDQQHRLFQVFSRLHAHNGYEGSGIGLALCRKIVEHHKGRIGVESAGSGKGSCFWFEIPYEAGEEE